MFTIFYVSMEYIVIKPWATFFNSEAFVMALTSTIKLEVCNLVTFQCQPIGTCYQQCAVKSSTNLKIYMYQQRIEVDISLLFFWCVPDILSLMSESVSFSIALIFYLIQSQTRRQLQHLSKLSIKLSILHELNASFSTAKNRRKGNLVFTSGSKR